MILLEIRKRAETKERAMNEKIYKCVCQVCGNEHEQKAEFLSAGRSRIMPNGESRLLLSCGNHTSAELKAAYAQSQSGK